MAESTGDNSVAVIEGPNGTAEIFEQVVSSGIIEYTVKINGETRTFNNLGEAYLVAGELAGKQT